MGNEQLVRQRVFGHLSRVIGRLCRPHPVKLLRNPWTVTLSPSASAQTRLSPPFIRYHVSPGLFVGAVRVL